jgi:hypothetical protein
MGEVAQRLGVKKYWLQARLNADRQSSAPRLQFHHYVGITPLWTHDTLETLKIAMAAELAVRRQRRMRKSGVPGDPI